MFSQWKEMATILNTDPKKKQKKTLEIFIVQFELALNGIFRLFPWGSSAFLGHICLFISNCWSNARNEKAMQHIVKYKSLKLFL